MSDAVPPPRRILCFRVYHRGCPGSFARCRPPAAPDCTVAVLWSGPADGPPRLDCPKCGVQRCILCHVSPFHEDQTCDEAKAAAAAAKAAQAAAQAVAVASADADDEEEDEDEDDDAEDYETFIERQIAAGNMRRCVRCSSELTARLYGGCHSATTNAVDCRLCFWPQYSAECRAMLHLLNAFGPATSSVHSHPPLTLSPPCAALPCHPLQPLSRRLTAATR